MAGDLLIVDLSYDSKTVFVSAGAAVTKTIFHSDKTWSQYGVLLKERIAAAAPSNRTNLPAHAYVTFAASNLHELQVFCGDKTNKAKLNNALVKLSRPLSVVSANANLAAWPGAASWEGAADLLIAALSKGNVVIEYYLQDGSSVLNVFGPDKSWDKVPE